MTKEGPPAERDLRQENEHAEALAFIKDHRDLIEHMGRGKVHVEPAPKGLDTFATDLETGTMYVHGGFYKKHGHDLAGEKTFVAVGHELGHMDERKDMLAEENGSKKFAAYLKRLKASQAYALMDNSVGDIRENKALVDRTNEHFRDTQEELYRDDLFRETDFTAAPRHIQFCQTILREAHVSGEKCVIAPEVREKIDALHAIKNQEGKELLDVMTDPDVPMSFRLRLQDTYIWPTVQELMEKDREDKKKEQGAPQEGKGNQSGEQGEQEGQKRDKGKGEKSKEVNPDDMFAEAYEKAKKHMPHAVSVEDVEKAFTEWKEKHGESPLDAADRAYAEKIGVSREDLRRYREIVQSLEQIINPETNEQVIEELRNIIRRIIAHRLKPIPAPRYPTEEGEELVDPTELYTQVQNGNLEPKVWETLEIKERRAKKFGEIEITLVCDRSSSMQGAKLVEQRKAAVLVMEALKEFAESCDEERVNMDAPLEVRSEVYAFQSSGEDAIPLKRMSKELGEKERIDVATTLSSAPGGTTDFVPLETIRGTLNEETIEKINKGELKKIIVIFTDGESDNPSRVREVLQDIRNKGVVAIGVGVTEEGRAALATYAPDARIASRAEDLAIVLGDLLKEHLSDL